MWLSSHRQTYGFSPLIYNRKTGFHPANLPERDKKLERFEQIIHRRNKRKLERERKAGDQPGLYDFAENNPHATVYGL